MALRSVWKEVFHRDVKGTRESNPIPRFQREKWLREGRLVTQLIRGTAETQVRLAKSQADGLSTPITAEMISPVPNAFLPGHTTARAQACGLGMHCGCVGVQPGGTWDPPNSFSCAADPRWLLMLSEEQRAERVRNGFST